MHARIPDDARALRAEHTEMIRAIEWAAIVGVVAFVTIQCLIAVGEIWDYASRIVP